MVFGAKIEREITYKEFLFRWDNGGYVTHLEAPPGSGFRFSDADRKGVKKFVKTASAEEEKRFGDMTVTRLVDVTGDEYAKRGWQMKGRMSVGVKP